MPTSLRAIYGKDLVHNAIDVSTDVQQAKNDIDLIFGDLDRDEHGKKTDLLSYQKKKTINQTINIFLFSQNLAYMKNKSTDNSLSVTPDINDDILQLDTDTHEGDCNNCCNITSDSLPC